METMHYIGLDVHKKTISYCIKSHQGRTLDQGSIASTRPALRELQITVSHLDTPSAVFE